MTNEELTDLRKAAEQALEALEDFHTDGYRRESCYNIITALRQALAGPANSTTNLVEPKASSQPEQEPVAWANSSDLQNFDMRVRTNRDYYHTVPLYTAPPSIEAAVLAEREACAALCSATAAGRDAEAIEEAIRARGEK